MGFRLQVMAAAIATAITALPVALPSPALAHASAVSRFPAEGAVLSASPTTARVTFNETVLGGSAALRVVTSTGRTLSGDARVSGAIVTAAVKGSLRPSRYALVWDVTSEDGHHVMQASGFSVGLSDPSASRKVIRLSGATVVLSGDRVGTRTLTLDGSLAGAIGQVEWRFPGLSAPFVWPLSGGRARGMLPFSGTYSVTVRAYTSATSSRVLAGSIAVRA